VNDAGQIVGSGVLNGQEHPFPTADVSRRSSCRVALWLRPNSQ